MRKRNHLLMARLIRENLRYFLGAAVLTVISVLLGFFPQIFFSFINVFTKFGG